MSPCGVIVLLGSETEPSFAPQPAWGQIEGPQLGTNAPGGQGLLLTGKLSTWLIKDIAPATIYSQGQDVR